MGMESWRSSIYFSCSFDNFYSWYEGRTGEKSLEGYFRYGIWCSDRSGIRYCDGSVIPFDECEYKWFRQYDPYYGERTCRSCRPGIYRCCTIYRCTWCIHFRIQYCIQYIVLIITVRNSNIACNAAGYHRCSSEPGWCDR